MGWKMTLGDAALSERDLTEGQWESIFVLANEGIPHAEIQLHPFHCPSCRNAIAVVTIAAHDPKLGVDGARLVVASLPRGALRAAISDDTPTVSAEPSAAVLG